MIVRAGFGTDGSSSLVVEGGTGGTSVNGAWSYIDSFVTHVSPSNGAQGTVVYIQGQNLLQGGYLEQVNFDTSVAEILRPAFDHFVRVIAPRRVQGPVAIALLASTGAYLDSSRNFTYLMPPEIFFVFPEVGQGGTVVTITGKNLLGWSIASQFSFTL